MVGSLYVHVHAWMRQPPDLTPQEGHAPLDILWEDDADGAMKRHKKPPAKLAIDT